VSLVIGVLGAPAGYHRRTLGTTANATVVEFFIHCPIIFVIVMVTTCEPLCKNGLIDRLGTGTRNGTVVF